LTDHISPQITLGFSPCPNDTFIFHSLVHGLASEFGLNLGQPTLADVETLNEWALQGRLDVTKLSFHALGHVLDDYVLLKSGSALGRGCGPLLIAKNEIDLKQLPALRIGVPGRLTTATMLLQMFVPRCKNIIQMQFDKILPALANDEVDVGVIIHESRFTYQREGFVVLQDLGAWWEDTSGCPIPLGGIVARRSLGGKLIGDIEKAIRESVKRALINPEKSREFIQKHAQEMDEKVTNDHIGLYVNDFSVDLGREGVNAVKVFLARGQKAGILPKSSFIEPFLPE